MSLFVWGEIYECMRVGSRIKYKMYSLKFIPHTSLLLLLSHHGYLLIQSYVVDGWWLVGSYFIISPREVAARWVVLLSLFTFTPRFTWIISLAPGIYPSIWQSPLFTHSLTDSPLYVTDLHNLFRISFIHSPRTLWTRLIRPSMHHHPHYTSPALHPRSRRNHR